MQLVPIIAAAVDHSSRPRSALNAVRFFRPVLDGIEVWASVAIRWDHFVPP